MMDKPQDENKISVPSGWSISPSMLKTLQEAADTLKRHHETIQRSLEGPMKDWAKFAEAQKEQQELMEKALKVINIPKLNLEWINDAALAYQRATAKTVYLSPPLTMVVRRKSEPSSESSEEVVALREANTILRQMVEEQRKTNSLQEELLKKQKKDKKKEESQILVLDQDGLLFIQNSPKKHLDLSKSPQKRNVLSKLTNQFIASKELFAISGCGSMDAFYKAIEELKADTRRLFRLKKDLITNDRKQGYRITNGYILRLNNRD